MRRRTAMFIALMLTGTLACGHAAAKGAAAGSAPRITKMTVARTPSARDPFGSDDANASPRTRRSAHSPADGRQHRAEIKLSRYLLAQQVRMQAREKEDVDARADRLYRASQVSAPVIVDAKACRRVGAHGESIYENCETAAAKPPAR